MIVFDHWRAKVWVHEAVRLLAGHLMANALSNWMWGFQCRVCSIALT
jgi:hypothetical protein